jgi:phosphatidate cytidylyltransferase
MAMTNLVKRSITGAALVLVITLSSCVSYIGFILLILAINILALLEFYRLFASAEILPRRNTGLILSVCLLSTNTLFIIGSIEWKILLINIPLAFFIFINELYLKAKNPFQNIAFTFLGIIYITMPLCFFINISFLPPGSHAYHFQIVLGCFFILWASDTGAYFAGRYFGRHLLFKRISPKKTWEGSLGGTICALMVSYFASWYFTEINSVHWMIIALIIVVTGTFGDLVKSLMKRSLNIKDSGTFLPGHGGILDRFDSLLGSAPFVFCYLILFPYA